MIKFDHVVKYYDGQPALNKVSFHLKKGEMAFLTGPSGSGKTTLLRLIYRDEVAESGSIIIADWDLLKLTGASIPYLRRNVGVVFQDFKLLPERTVRENVEITLRIQGVSAEEARERVTATLKLVGLRHKSDALPTQLSGGEQQRVVIARAVIGNPAVLLADEPTGNLDPETSKEIMDVFKAVHAKGATVFIATHDPSLFKHSGCRVFRLNQGGLSS